MARSLLLGDSSKTNFQTRSNNAKDNVMQEATLNNSNGTGGPHFTVEGEANRPHSRMTLELVVTDPEVCSELRAHESEDERTRYALAALRIGVHAMRQASGVIDARSVRDEVTQMLTSLRDTLAEHSVECTGGISNSLKTYFDPESGHLAQRLDRLVKRDGELDGILNRHLGDDSSTVAKTLASHVGQQSPLFKMLSPEQADGLLASLREVIGLALQSQRDQIVRNFSLDNNDSALSRLLSEVTDANGQLRKGLAEDVAEVRNEFSLDNEEGALARLVTRVEKAQQQISDQFSQDNEDSAMSRMAKLLESIHEGVAVSALLLCVELLSCLERELT